MTKGKMDKIKEEMKKKSENWIEVIKQGWNEVDFIYKLHLACRAHNSKSLHEWCRGRYLRFKK